MLGIQANFLGGMSAMPNRPTQLKKDYSLPHGDANCQERMQICNQGILGKVFKQTDGDISTVVRLEEILGRQIPST